MADETKPSQPLAKAPVDDDQPTRQMSALKGEALAAAEAEVAKSKVTTQDKAAVADKTAEQAKATPIYRPGSKPAPQTNRPEEPTDSEITLVRPVTEAAVVIASTPTAESVVAEVVKPQPAEPVTAEIMRPKLTQPPKAAEAPKPAAAETPKTPAAETPKSTAAETPKTPAAETPKPQATAPVKTTAVQPAPVPPKAAAPDDKPALKPLAPAPLTSAPKTPAATAPDIKNTSVDAIKPVAATEKPEQDKAKPGTADKPEKPSTPKAADKPDKPRKKGTRRRTLVGLLIALLIIALSGATTVAVAANRYGGQAKIGATLAGVSVTGQTEEELVQTANTLVAGMNVAIDVDGQQKTFTLQQLGITLDQDSTTANVLDTGGRFSWWPFRFTNYPLTLNCDADAVRQAVTDSFFGDAQYPVDSTVEVDESMAAFSAVPGSDGKSLDTTAVIDAVNQLAKGETPDVVTLQSTVLPAAIQLAAAQQAVDTANNMVAQKYTFSSEKKSYTLDASEMAPWVTFNANDATGTIDVGIDQAAMAEQLPGILNSKVANPPVNRRILYTPEGAQIAIETWGQSGTVVSNSDAALTALEQALPAAQSMKFSVTTKSQNYSIEKVQVGGAYDQPHGSKWIDVSQKTFKVTLYEGTTMIKQFTCVVGAVRTPTTSGTFYINRKYAVTSMSGHNLDGSTYHLSYVPWTMYFHNGEALHGAPWRSSFGYRGSHGCVNLPVSAAKYIFEWAPLGTRVVVHF